MTEFYSRLFRNATEGDAKAPIVGHLPEWFNTNNTVDIIYNGPVGKWDFEHETARHWFDGMSILTSFKVNGNFVTMKKRFLKSDAFEKATANGKYIITEYATPGTTDPEKSAVSKLVSSVVPSEMTDNGACNVYAFPTCPNPTYVAASETCLLRPINPDSLETLPKKIDLSSVVNIAAARPILDPWSGDLYNLSGTFLTGLKYHFIKFEQQRNPDTTDIPSSLKVVSTISSRMKTCFSYYHTFGLTENYLVMVEQPWVANSLKLMASKVRGQSFKDCLEWCPQEKNQFHIVEKSTGNHVKVKYLSSNAFFFLNVINAFEDETGNVIIDLIGYDSPDVLDQMYLSELRENRFNVKDPSKVFRFTLPLPSDAGDKSVVVVDPKVVCPESGCEHPSLNPLYRGRPYRYTYVTGWLNSVNRGHFANALTKIDMETGESVAWQGETFAHPAEAVFIPKPDAINEDDGLIVAAVTDVRPDVKDFLLFVDARNMTEIGRASMDDDIPFSSHACLIKH